MIVAGGKLSKWNKQYRLFDVPIPFVLEILTVIEFVTLDRPQGSLLLAQGLILPLCLRTRNPRATLLFICIVAMVVALLNMPTVALAAVLIGGYSVASLRNQRDAIWGWVAAEVVVVFCAEQFNPATGGLIASIIFLTGLTLAAFFLGTTVRANRLYLASLVERTRQLEFERDQQARLAVAAERTRIARDMHDIIAHSLSVVVTLAEGASATVKKEPGAATDAMQQAASTGRQALTEVRRLLNVLRDDEPPSLVPLPELSRLDGLIDDVRATGLSVIMTTSGMPGLLPPSAESTIFRIVQESLTNVLKHANSPTRVLVTLAWQDNGVTIDVRDDGTESMDMRRNVGNEGYGLRGMRERVALFDGELESGPIAPRGWLVRARLSFLPEVA
ncbi:MAG TPA: histidine kinase [Thermomicrobiales bacterium]|nr:histidine kinase [Thermomicrobiales bacterium]